MTKTKKTSLKLLICVLAMLLLATVLVACNKNEYDHFDHEVSFVYNQGNLEGDAKTQYLGVMDNSLISLWPGHPRLPEATIIGYYLTGWYLPAEVDEEGNPKTDENGFVLTQENPIDFETYRVHSDIKLYGNFAKMPTLTYINIKTNEPIGGENGTIQDKPGSTLNEPSDAFKPTLADHTFLGKYYTDSTGSTEFKWPYTLNSDVNVYVDFLEGVWALVGNESQFKTAILGNKNIYLQKDLDFSTQTTMWALGTYSGELNGNNHTIKNVYRSHEASRSNTSNFGGVFGKLGKTANIHDVTFENIYMSFRKADTTWEPTELNVGLLASEAEEGAKLSNVKLTGVMSYENVFGITAENWIAKDGTKKTDVVNCQNTVKMLEGVWALAHTASEVEVAVRNNRNVYLLNDIDMKGTSVWPRATFNGTFEGNGFTVSNLSRNINVSASTDKSLLGGVFGALGENAKISNVKFKDVTVKVDIASNVEPSEISVGMFACEAKAGASVSNVELSGTLTYTSRSEGATFSKWIANNNATDIIDCDYDKVTVSVQ